MSIFQAGRQTRFVLQYGFFHLLRPHHRCDRRQYRGIFSWFFSPGLSVEKLLSGEE
jgi:hypothetical protein